MKAKIVLAPLITPTLITLIACNGDSPPLQAATHTEILSTDVDPNFVRGDLGAADPTDDATLEATLRDALVAQEATLGLDAKATLVRIDRDALGFAHARFVQQRNGLPVIGADFIVHVQGNGSIYAISGDANVTRAPDAAPRITSSDAEAVVQRRGFELTRAARLVYVRTETSGLVLAYSVAERGEDHGRLVKNEVFVSATTGQVVAVHPRIFRAKNRAVYSASNKFTQPGSIKRSEGQGTSTDVTINAAYDNTGATWDFYHASFGRDSFDGKGAQLVSTVHYGSAFDNAYWDSEEDQMVYGDGNSQVAPLARALDVTAHELTHAVTDRTAGLIYSGQSGGLNEAMSDIMAAATEAWVDGGVNAGTWLVGEDIWTPSSPGDALRYMADPAADGDSLDYYPSYKSGVDVHYSSGIPNLAFKLLTTGGTHPRGRTSVVVPALGIEKARAIFYRALVFYMSSTTSFQAARTATAQAAQDLYGASEVAAVHAAWSAVAVPGAPTSSSSSTSSSATTLTSGTAKTKLSGATGSQTLYRIDVPAGASKLTVATSAGSGDVDLYVRFGSAPTTSAWDYRPYKDGNAETVEISAPNAGTYYVLLNGYAAYSGVTLKATVQ